ncbi:MAG: A/G-specific adenine glycosylase [Micavibrio aeruginosavorus]|uniref:Adenine DNA glycosylase n=1 Tax=Micavibrio aeruginosavorus TaxID=349221 RepID=A0A7T5UHK8_9BACT|nr:MAG: A/G-specific adenine glycosylase [Micavibrio aeruginosavorus]
MSGSIIPDKLPVASINSFRKSVLAWYDQNRRTLPWRALPGQKPNPYHVWLSEVMLQQTVVATVVPYFQSFVRLWPTVHHLAQAPQDDVLKAWAGLGYYARARNLHKASHMISTELGGVFPQAEQALKSIPGIGDYTAAAILSIAFDQPAVVVDGNVERVVSRYFAITEPLPKGKILIRKAAALLAQGRIDRPADYAQALMDLGAAICVPKNPRCSACPVSRTCQARKQGHAASFPVRATKKAKPFKSGAIYLIKSRDNCRILLEKRPEEGLFGGMSGFLTSEWGDQGHFEHPERILSLGMPQKMRGALIKHSFTHFDLELQGYELIALRKPSGTSFWVNKNDILESGLPSLFQKFARFIVDNKRYGALL